MRYFIITMVLLFIIVPMGLESARLDQCVMQKIKLNHLAHVQNKAKSLDIATENDCRPNDYEVASMSAYELYKLNPKFVHLKEMNKKDVIQMIIEVSLDHEINPAIVLAIAHTESGFRLGAISPKGAIGLMQLMPGTAAFLRVDPYNPVENVIGGIRYFKAMRAKFSGYTTLGLAAYNAGPSRIRNLSIPNITETQNYVVKVYDYYYHYSKELDT